MPITLEDITAGLVVTLDTAVLRAHGDCETNAVLGPEGDRAVVDVHDFLIVAVHGLTKRCTAVPLFTKTAVGNQPLIEGKKAGTGAGWIGSEVYFSRWQHWRMSLAAVIAAASVDPAIGSARRRYAAHDTSTLDDIRNWETRNRAAYRPA